MVIRFELENFLSFNSNQSFLWYQAIWETNKNIHLKKNGVKLLNLSAIYGANASGKTNLIKAIDLFKFIVIESCPNRYYLYVFMREHWE